jgi:putative oxidoreductase
MEKTMNPRAERARDLGLLLLRVGASSFLLTHGIPKLQRLLAGGEIRFFDFLGLGARVSLSLAVVGEVVGPLLVLVGLFTRPAALLPAFTMAVAAFAAQSGQPFAKRELALLYLLAFASFALLGPGRWSVDGWRASARRGSSNIET